MNSMAHWLAPLDALPLECDGMTRVISTLLHREGISHRAFVGSMSVTGAGRIPMHCWIELQDGRICDFRARMWLGEAESVPHGVFVPEGHHQYKIADEMNAVVSKELFQILTNILLSSFWKFENNTG